MASSITAGGDIKTALNSAEITGPKDVAGPRFPRSLSRLSFPFRSSILSLSLFRDPPTLFAGPSVFQFMTVEPNGSPLV